MEQNFLDKEPKPQELQGANKKEKQRRRFILPLFTLCAVAVGAFLLWGAIGKQEAEQQGQLVTLAQTVEPVPMATAAPAPARSEPEAGIRVIDVLQEGYASPTEKDLDHKEAADFALRYVKWAFGEAITDANVFTLFIKQEGIPFDLYNVYVDGEDMDSARYLCSMHSVTGELRVVGAVLTQLPGHEALYHKIPNEETINRALQDEAVPQKAWEVIEAGFANGTRIIDATAISHTSINENSEIDAQVNCEVRLEDGRLYEVGIGYPGYQVLAVLSDPYGWSDRVQTASPPEHTPWPPVNGEELPAGYGPVYTPTPNPTPTPTPKR